MHVNLGVIKFPGQGWAGVLNMKMTGMIVQKAEKGPIKGFSVGFKNRWSLCVGFIFLI